MTVSRETSAYLKALDRMIRAIPKRAAAEEVDSPNLVELVNLQETLSLAIAQTIVIMNKAGYSYADMARDMGCSREAVFQRSRKVTT